MSGLTTRVSPVTTPDLTGRPGRRYGPSLVLLLGAGAGFVAIFVVAVGSTLGQRVEDRSLGAATGDHSALLDLVTVPHLAAALGVVVGLALLRRRWRLALRLGLVVTVANVAGQLLKHELLTRPSLTDLTSANSFPSGHAIAFASILTALVMAVPPVLRSLTAVAAAGVLATVAAQLLQFGWHRTSDVLGSLLLVAVVCGLVALVSGGLRPVAPPTHVRVVVLALLGLGTLVVLAAGLLAVLAWFGSRPVEGDVVLRGGQLVAAGFAAAAMALAARLPLD